MAQEDGWRGSFKKTDNFFGTNGQSGYTSVSRNAPPQKLPLREVIEKAEQILKVQINSQLDPIDASILLEELRQEAGVNEWNWEQKYLKPLREKLERALALPTEVSPLER